MKFHSFPARPDWQKQFGEVGFGPLADGWIEAAPEPFAVEFSVEEVADVIVPAATVCSDIAMATGQDLFSSPGAKSLLELLGIPPLAHEAVIASWRRNDRTLYGRFDFAFDGTQIKLLELNFDTPTLVCESAVLQRLWLEDMQALGNFEGAGQFNRLPEKLVEAFGGLISANETLHLASFHHAVEDTLNVQCLMHFARKTGRDCKFFYMNELAIKDADKLVDEKGNVIRNLFKLYPWEVIFDEVPDLVQFVATNKVRFFEPAWKVAFSSKAFLALMWKRATGHPCLLETVIEDKSLSDKEHVRKPFFGRAGIDVSIEKNPAEHNDTKKYVLQELAPLAQFDDYHCVISVWMIGNQPAGMAIRSDKSKITGKNAYFVPHFVREKPSPDEQVHTLYFAESRFLSLVHQAH